MATFNDNELTALPPEIGNLTNLIELQVADNQLTSLPPEIGNLTNLTRLDLWDNKFTALPLEMQKLVDKGVVTFGSPFPNWWYEKG